MHFIRLVYISCLILLFITGKITAQWVQTGLNGGYVRCLLTGPGADSTNLFAGVYGSGIFLSTDNGSSWNNISTGLTSTEVTSLVFSGSNLFAGTFGGVFISTNYGGNWSKINSGLTDTGVRALAASDSNLFAMTSASVFISTNNGTTWAKTGTSPWLNVYNARAIATSGTKLFVGTDGDGIYASTNNGNNWTHSGVDGNYIETIYDSGTNLFAGTLSWGAYISTNNGQSWNEINTGLIQSNPSIYSFTSIGSTVFAVGNGAYYSTNNGTNWIIVNTGLPDGSALSRIGDILFVGTSQGVYMRHISEMITSVNDLHETKLPDNFLLEQNYPNPFNPSTIISYSIPKAGHIRISVYNLIGSKVAAIVNEYKPAGNYSVQFNGNNLASGVYWYRLESGNFSKTMKFILMK